jgi:hypothetical protein
MDALASGPTMDAVISMAAAEVRGAVMGLCADAVTGEVPKPEAIASLLAQARTAPGGREPRRAGVADHAPEGRRGDQVAHQGLTAAAARRS